MLKLNCDIGEGYGSWSMGLDKEIMPYIDMANIACGFHASDPHIMRETVALAKAHGVSVGAHPGYPDLHGFGRRPMAFSEQELEDILLYQVGALQAICEAQSLSLDYVKPHGALYNAMMTDKVVLIGVLKAMAKLPQNLPLLVMANGQQASIRARAEAYQVPLLFEVFCDRAYTDDGNLASRKEPGATHQSLDAIQNQVSQLLADQSLTSINGKIISVKADTLCVHGDNQHALEAVKAIKGMLQSV